MQLNLSRRSLISLAFSLGALSASGCGAFRSGGSLPTAPLVAEPWPEAEALFHRDPRWMGGDGVYSIDLGNSRVLWLFGDSFIATSPNHTRSESKLVRNSAAIQTGYDPASASIHFFWSEQNGEPSDFIIDPVSSRWLWPAHGVRLGNRLILFLSEIASSSGGLGFTGKGWKAVAIDNPDANPDQWTMRFLDTPNRFSLSVGTSVYVSGDYLYAYAVPNEHPGPIYLARWSLTEATEGNLTNIAWYMGARGWVPQSTLSDRPTSLRGDGQAEFNVFPNLPHTPYLMVQTHGFGASVLAVSTASTLIGLWSGLQQFYRPPEADRDDIMIYSGKMHPMLTNSGSDFVASYCTNSKDFNRLVQDTSLYYPRILKVRWTK